MTECTTTHKRIIATACIMLIATITLFAFGVIEKFYIIDAVKTIEGFIK